MKLKSVAGRNVHGLTFAHNLTGCDVIVGTNFSGKTAVAKLIRIGLTGKLPPPIGERGLYKLAGNSETEGSMDMHLSFDNGMTVAQATFLVDKFKFWLFSCMTKEDSK